MTPQFTSLINAGIAYNDAVQLRRISMTLQRWFELECGDSNEYASFSIVRGKKIGKLFEYDDDGKPFREVHPNDAPKASYYPVPDRETGARKRLARIMRNYPGLTAFIQTDPRGCALYIGENLTDTNYNRGIAVYK